jgi:fluoroacetyl-CoA thioesterase
MKSRPPNGLAGEMTFVVGAEHAIDFASGGMPAVFSTPKMIGLLERTARESLMPYLENSEQTVGVEIDIKHLAPTPIGARVTLSTRVISSEGNFVSFTVEARDEHEIVSKGIHKRAVIQVDSFARRVEKKRAKAQ